MTSSHEKEIVIEYFSVDIADAQDSLDRDYDNEEDWVFLGSQELEVAADQGLPDMLRLLIGEELASLVMRRPELLGLADIDDAPTLGGLTSDEVEKAINALHQNTALMNGSLTGDTFRHANTLKEMLSDARSEKRDLITLHFVAQH